VTHDEMVAEVQRRGAQRGVISHYCGRAERCSGDRGQPDLFLAGLVGVAWMEVKTPADRLKPAQTQWMHMLKASGQKHYVIREAQLHDDTVDGILDSLAYGQPVLFREAG
jgi:hypothetical protein